MNQLRSGAVLSYLSIFITIFIALLYTPIMIRLLGQSEYGLYSLVGAVVGYLSILDMGLGNAIVRYIARNRSLENKEDEARLCGMFFVLYSLLGILTLIIGGIFYLNIDLVFASNLTNLEMKKAKIMVLILIFNFAISFPLSVYGSIIQAYERFIFLKLLGILRSLMIPFFTLPLLLMEYGSISVVLVTSLLNIFILLCNVYYGHKYLDIIFKFNSFNFKLLKEILIYSFFIFLNIIVDKIYWSTDQVILGIIGGTIPVSIYAIAMQFITLYMMFSTAISGILLPKVSIMVVNNATNEDFSKLMINFGRIQYLIIAFILSGFLLVGKDFIYFWVGIEYDEAYIITSIIMLALVGPLIQNMGIAILQAKNKQMFRTVVLLCISIINVIITIPLAIHYGGVGSAIATAISLLVGNVIIMNLYYHFKVKLNMIHFWINIFKLTIPVILSMTTSYLLSSFFINNDIFTLFLEILVFSIVYVLFIWFLGLNNNEKNMIVSLLFNIFTKKK